MTNDNTKHTPGPWKVGLTIGSAHTTPEGPWGWYQTDIDGPPGEGCFLELRQYHGGETGQANAHLIAAAPELYEALADCYVLALAWASTYAESHGLPMGEQAEPHATIIKNSRAALRKAEGRS